MSTSRNTLGRLTSLPRSIRIGRPAKPAQSRQSSSSSTSASPCSSWTYGNPSEKAVASRLPPIRAHILREPLPYPVGLKLQNDIIDLRLKRRETGAAGAKAGVDGGGKGGKVDVMLLVEHTPTYTTGRRDNTPQPDRLHPEEKKVQNVGADFFITKRGGQVTYHGPGQLVGYPIFDLNAMDLSTRCYVEFMQRLLGEYCTSTLGLEGIEAPHKDGHVGVFAGDSEKVASIGIHLRHRISSHGFAINITPEPVNWFDLVVACGLTDMKAVSAQTLLERAGARADSNGKERLSVRMAARDIASLFERAYGRKVIPLLGADSGLGVTGEGSRAQEQGEGEEAEVHEIRKLVTDAEDEARKINEKNGGWRTEPDMQKDIP